MQWNRLPLKLWKLIHLTSNYLELMYLHPQVIFHQIYIILHDLPLQIYQGEDKKSTDSQTRRKSGKSSKTSRIPPMRSATDPMHKAFSRPILEGFPESKSGAR